MALQLYRAVVSVAVCVVVVGVFVGFFYLLLIITLYIQFWLAVAQMLRVFSVAVCCLRWRRVLLAANMYTYTEIPLFVSI